MTMFKQLKSALKGTEYAWAQHRRATEHKPTIITAIQTLQQQLPANAEEDLQRPIFLLSAGWRSGSTLVQRLLMSDRRVLIWGEPYDECGLIQAMADSMRAFRTGWPPKEYYYDGTPPQELSGEWIANLFPSLMEFRNAQRKMFDTLFAAPALNAGAKYWGIKEVRFTIEHAHYLRWLYPNARFIFLYRNPVDAYQSYYRYGSSWYDVYPDKPVFTPTAFGQHWKKLLDGYLQQHQSFNSLLICYEDLVTGQFPLEKLDALLDINIDRSLLRVKVGSSNEGGHKTDLPFMQRWLLKRAVSPTAQQLGYNQW